MILKFFKIAGALELGSQKYFPWPFTIEIPPLKDKKIGGHESF
jgi:hypothetical protein